MFVFYTQGSEACNFYFFQLSFSFNYYFSVLLSKLGNHLNLPTYLFCFLLDFNQSFSDFHIHENHTGDQLKRTLTSEFLLYPSHSFSVAYLFCNFEQCFPLPPPPTPSLFFSLSHASFISCPFFKLKK